MVKVKGVTKEGVNRLLMRWWLWMMNERHNSRLGNMRTL
jgi:hypothetical protein